ncbi:MAG: hypothetical protein GF408_01825 [Candidatus Omnitrophica bacterium]|nr:hypothetical protein [Candidatus Omnitrophota bacterium]
MDDRRYEMYSRRQKKEFEDICSRCGECCGAKDDPCVSLAMTKDGKYCCRDYKNRLGPRKTVSGKSFTCVTIREHINSGTLRPGCAYRNLK